jgi:hypothetical protein
MDKEKRHHLTAYEEKLVSRFKAEGLLKSYTADDWDGVTRNGGVAVLCSDGDIDAFEHHAKVISRRPHCIKVFGGPLLLAKNYPGYHRPNAGFLMEQIQAGMEAKKTGTVFLKFHHPCAMAIKYHLDLIQVVGLAHQVHENFLRGGLVNPEKIFTFLHVKKKDKQATYLLNPNFVLEKHK